MTQDEGDHQTDQLVVVNEEEQYSVWSVEDPLPEGWRDAGFRGSKDACLDYIETVWTDMRPRSVREAMDGASDERDG